MPDKYILDADGNAVPEPDLLKWGEWFARHERHVAITEIGCARISTVFLGLDHNFFGDSPLLWETLVFGGKHDGEMDRYSTLADAKRGHDAMVGKVTRSGLPRAPASKLRQPRSW